jgi:hypothetical protein
MFTLCSNLEAGGLGVESVPRYGTGMESIATLTARHARPGRLDWIGLRPARLAMSHRSIRPR